MSFKINWSGKSIDYTEEEINIVAEVMRHGDPQTQGPYQKQFEADFANYVGSPHCFAMTSCTHALEIIADLIQIKPGDEVIVPGHTYCSTAIPFARVGGTLKWADIDPDSFTVSLDSIKRLKTQRTKAIIVVHLYGMIDPEIEAIAAYAQAEGIYLIEDCAQALGSFKHKKACGTFGDFGAYSFHAQKNITTLGEGGLLLVKDEKMAKNIRGLRHNGHAPFENQSEYWQPAMSNVDLNLEGVWPHKFTICEAQVALGSALLKRLGALTDARRKRAKLFQQRLASFNELVLQKCDEPSTHSHHLLAARYDGKRWGKTNHDLIKMLSGEYRIKVIAQYYPLYRYDLFKKMGFGEAHCPNIDHFYDNMISFPFHLTMSDEDFEYLIKSTISALTKLRG
ncbi:DegT/DnrJ/EryC1/StrS family aminotransferase [Deltaproteobacteria bacterium TL4]